MFQVLAIIIPTFKPCAFANSRHFIQCCETCMCGLIWPGSFTLCLPSSSPVHEAPELQAFLWLNDTVSHCLDMLYFTFPFIGWWAFRLLHFNLHKWCRCEYLCTSFCVVIFSSQYICVYVFIQTHPSLWNCYHVVVMV